MYSTSRPVVDLDTTRFIHQDMASIIALREDVRLLVAAYNKYKHLIRRLFPPEKPDRLDKLFPPSDGQTPGGDVQSGTALQQRSTLLELLEELESRVQDAKENLEHQLETSEMIIRQLENLLSLVRRKAIHLRNLHIAAISLMKIGFQFAGDSPGPGNGNLEHLSHPLSTPVIRSGMQHKIVSSCPSFLTD